MADKEVHLRDYLAIIRKHDFIVMVSFLLIFGSALIVGLYLPREYESYAVIEVQPSSNTSGLSSLMQNVISRGVDQVSMETICNRFTSYSLLDRVIGNLKKRYPDMSSDLRSPDSLAPKVTANIIPDTRMIEVAVRMRVDEGGSQSAAKIANELVTVMQEQRSSKTDAELLRRQNFIDEKIEDIKAQIEESDRDIKEFLKNNGSTLVWSAHADHLFARQSSLTDLKEGNEASLTASKKKLDELRSRLSGEPEYVEYSKTFSKDALWDKYRLDLANMERVYVSLISDLGEENPEVVSMKAQIDNVKEKMKNLAEEVVSSKTESRNPTHQSLMTQIIETELEQIVYSARRDLAVKLLDDLEEEKNLILSRMPEKQFQLEKLYREAEYKLSLYRGLLARKLETEIWAVENNGDNSKIKGGIEIVDIAQPGSKPVSPRIKFICAVAGLVGIAVGLAMAFLTDYFENTYQSPDEAKEDLNIPILGVVPFIKDRENLLSSFPVIESPMSIEAESFRTLVTNIEFSSSEAKYRSLLMTSSGSGEGKSFAIANLAVAMAQAEKQIVLIDCDMRKAIQHKIFGLANQVGLTNLLVGNAELESVIQNTKVPNLRLLCCGPIPPNPAELLKSKKLDDILDNLRETCDIMLFDCPPVLPVADALILASKLDGVMLLADLSHTPREVIKQAVEQISRLDVPLLGLICNSVDMAKYGSYYYYDHDSDRRHYFSKV